MKKYNLKLRLFVVVSYFSYLIKLHSFGFVFAKFVIKSV